MEFLKALTEIPGVPGREERVRDLILERTEGLFDEIGFYVKLAGKEGCLAGGVGWETPG